jgi:hypothetical protein
VQGTWQRKAGSGQQCTRGGQRGVGEEDGVLVTAQLVMGGVRDVSGRPLRAPSGQIRFQITNYVIWINCFYVHGVIKRAVRLVRRIVRRHP